MPRGVRIDRTIYVPKDTFILDVEGDQVRFTKGQTRVRAGHPVLVGREHMFEPMRVDYDIEQATSAPGEYRGARV